MRNTTTNISYSNALGRLDIKYILEFKVLILYNNTLIDDKRAKTMNKTKKVVFFQETGYCGEGSCHLEEYELEEGQELTEDFLDEVAWDLARQRAESMGREFCPNEDTCDGLGCNFEHSDNTNVCGYWEEYDPETHDGVL